MKITVVCPRLFDCYVKVAKVPCVTQSQSLNTCDDFVDSLSVTEIIKPITKNIIALLVRRFERA